MSNRRSRSIARKVVLKTDEPKVVLKTDEPKDSNPFTDWDDDRQTYSQKDRLRDDRANQRVGVLDQRVYGGKPFDEVLLPDGTLVESVEGFSIAPDTETRDAVYNAIERLYTRVQRLAEEGVRVLIAKSVEDFKKESCEDGLMAEWNRMLHMVHELHPKLCDRLHKRDQIIDKWLDDRIRAQLHARDDCQPLSGETESHILPSVRNFAACLTEQVMYDVEHLQDRALGGAAGGARKRRRV
jgi:hypothetical protein